MPCMHKFQEYRYSQGRWMRRFVYLRNQFCRLSANKKALRPFIYSLTGQQTGLSLRIFGKLRLTLLPFWRAVSTRNKWPSLRRSSPVLLSGECMRWLRSHSEVLIGYLVRLQLNETTGYCSFRTTPESRLLLFCLKPIGQWATSPSGSEATKFKSTLATI